MTTDYWTKAGIDFTHCEKGQCKNCSDAQKRRCEKEFNRPVKVKPHLPEEVKHGSGFHFM